MVLTLSTMVALGSPALDFSLPSVVSEKKVSLEDFRSKKVLLIMFVCRHCPYVQHIKDFLSQFGDGYKNSEVGIVAISSNDAVQYPQDGPTSLKEFCEEMNFQFPFLFDEDQKIAKNYKAACTPDFFLYDSNRRLVYRGQLDDSRPGNQKPVTGKDLKEALTAVLQGKPVRGKQIPSMGCNIKWKSGNAPDYFH